MAQTTKQLVTTSLDQTRTEWPAELRGLPNDRERTFVMAYVMNGGKGSQAAKDAGYQCSSSESYASTAYRLLNKVDRIKDAIIALSKRQIRALAPKAVQAIKETLESPYHKDRLRAAEMVLSRTDPSVQRVDLDVNVKFDPIKVILDDVRRMKNNPKIREALIAEYGAQGLEYYERLLAKEDVVEADFVEISPSQMISLNKKDDPDATLDL